MNPPGGLVKEFWRKLIKSFDVEQAVWIGYSLEQLQTLQSLDTPTPLSFSICVPRRRIAFVENEAKQAARIAKLKAAGKRASVASQPSHGNYITYIGPNRERFAEEFDAFGQVVIR